MKGSLRGACGARRRTRPRRHCRHRWCSGRRENCGSRPHLSRWLLHAAGIDASEREAEAVQAIYRSAWRASFWMRGERGTTGEKVREKRIIFSVSTTRGALSSAQQQHSRRTTTATEFVELSLSLCKMSPPVAAAAAGSASCCFVPALLAEQSSRRRWHARRGIRTAPEASSSAAAASKRLHAAATTATAPRRLPAARGTGPFFPSVRTRQKKHTSASHRASELDCASGALQLRKRAFRKPHALFFLLSFFAATAT